MKFTARCADVVRGTQCWGVANTRDFFPDYPPSDYTYYRICNFRACPSTRWLHVTKSFHGNFTRPTKEQTGCWRRSRFPLPPVRHLRHYSVSRLSCSYQEELANELPAHLFRFPVVVTVCFLSAFLV